MPYYVQRAGPVDSLRELSLQCIEFLIQCEVSHRGGGGCIAISQQIDCYDFSVGHGLGERTPLRRRPEGAVQSQHRREVVSYAVLHGHLLGYAIRSSPIRPRCREARVDDELSARIAMSC